MATLSIDDLVRMAKAQNVPYGTIAEFVKMQWDRLVKSDQLKSIERDIVMLPAYGRHLVNLSGSLERARAAGYDPEKIRLAYTFIEQADVQLRRMSNMVQVAIAEAIKAGTLPDNYQVQLGEWTRGKYVVVGVAAVGAIALVIAGLAIGPWVAAAALVVKALAVATGLVLAATAWVTAQGASRPGPGDPITTTVADAAVEFSHSAVWIVAIVAAAAGLWFLSSRKRRVA